MDETDPVTDPDALRSHHPSVRVERDGPVVTVTLDRPESKNACTGDMWVAIGATFRELSYSGARAVVLTGAGGDFCSGADLTPTKGSGGGGTRPPMATMTDAMRVLGDVVLAIHTCPLPVVAKVDGLCVGAGLGLALAADLTWCSDRARFSAIFAKRGLSLDFGTSWLLRQRIGVHKAKELAFTAKIVSGPEAFDLGLVNAVVPADELDGGHVRGRRDDRGRSADRARGRRSASSTARRPRRSRRRSSSRRSRRASTCTPTTCARRSWPSPSAVRPSSRAGSTMATDEQTGSWDEVLDDLQQRREASRVDGRRRAAARSTAPRASSTPGPRIAHLLDPGSFQELGTLVGGEDAPADAVVMGSGRIDGRPVMVAAEDFTVKAGTISGAANAKRYRVAEIAVTDRVPLVMMLEGAGFRADGKGHGTRTPTDMLAQARCSGRVPLVTAVLGASAGHGALRRAAVGLQRDEPARGDLHRRPAGRVRVDGRDDHQGGPRRPGRGARQRPRPQRGRARRGRARPGARLPQLLPVVGVVVPAPRSRAATTVPASSPRSSTSSPATAGASTTCAR